VSGYDRCRATRRVSLVSSRTSETDAIAAEHTRTTDSRRTRWQGKNDGGRLLLCERVSLDRVHRRNNGSTWKAKRCTNETGASAHHRLCHRLVLLVLLRRRIEVLTEQIHKMESKLAPVRYRRIFTPLFVCGLDSLVETFAESESISCKNLAQSIVAKERETDLHKELQVVSSSSYLCSRRPSVRSLSLSSFK
jgi:hypothetical protein